MLYKVPASGGTPVPVTAFDESRGETSHRHPQFLPDGQHFIFVARDDEEGQRSFAIFGASLDSAETKLIAETPASARYSRTVNESCGVERAPSNRKASHPSSTETLAQNSDSTDNDMQAAVILLIGMRFIAGIDDAAVICRRS